MILVVPGTYSSSLPLCIGQALAFDAAAPVSFIQLAALALLTGAFILFARRVNHLGQSLGSGPLVSNQAILGRVSAVTLDGAGKRRNLTFSNARQLTILRKVLALDGCTQRGVRQHATIGRVALVSLPMCELGREDRRLTELAPCWLGS
jgi:hypothetical protein